MKAQYSRRRDRPRKSEYLRSGSNIQCEIGSFPSLCRDWLESASFTSPDSSNEKAYVNRFFWSVCSSGCGDCGCAAWRRVLSAVTAVRLSWGACGFKDSLWTCAPRSGCLDWPGDRVHSLSECDCLRGPNKARLAWLGLKGLGCVRLVGGKATARVQVG